MPSLKEEQKRIIDFDQGNILVSASAGSGKTFVMIERLVRLITQKKAKVSEILAVTYTESAAKDMKEKLRHALTERIRETGDPELIEELKSLNGIGDAKASAIIEYRSKNGGFKSIDDIKNVNGISESLYEKIKDSITV